jgi:hypothetical protein
MEINKFEYHINKDNIITSAILPLNNIIDKTNINNIMNEITGGRSPYANDIQLQSNHPRFEGLGVPVGLIVSKNNKHLLDMSKQPKIKEISCKVMDEEDYSVLLDKIAKKRNKKGKTKKTKKMKKEKMRKSKKILI